MRGLCVLLTVATLVCEGRGAVVRCQRRQGCYDPDRALADLSPPRPTVSSESVTISDGPPWFTGTLVGTWP